MKRGGMWSRVVVDVAVVLGLFFLGFELKQNTDMMRAQTRGDVTQSILTLIQMERHSDVVSANLKRERGDSLTAQERYLVETMANATFRVWENTYYQRSAGLFDEAEFAADLVVWRESLEDPIWADLWRRTRESYSSSFRTRMDDLLP